MSTPKRICGLSIQEIEISEVDFQNLQTIASLHLDKAWDIGSTSPLSAEQKKLVKKFKLNLKKNLYIKFQGSFCCYCSTELTNHLRTFDLEHIIAKVGRCNVVFALENLALSCATCNGNKSEKKVTVSAGPDPNSVPSNSCDYIIFHPHHDEWSNYFETDQYQRIVAKPPCDLKAKKTIEICGINKLNAFRLARRFDWLNSNVKRHDDWINFYDGIYAPTNQAKQKKMAQFAKTLLASQGDPSAAGLYELLKERIDYLMEAAP